MIRATCKLFVTNTCPKMTANHVTRASWTSDAAGTIDQRGKGPRWILSDSTRCFARWAEARTAAPPLPHCCRASLPRLSVLRATSRQARREPGKATRTVPDRRRNRAARTTALAIRGTVRPGARSREREAPARMKLKLAPLHALRQKVRAAMAPSSRTGAPPTPIAAPTSAIPARAAAAARRRAWRARARSSAVKGPTVRRESAPEAPIPIPLPRRSAVQPGRPVRLARMAWLAPPAPEARVVVVKQGRRGLPGRMALPGMMVGRGRRGQPAAMVW